MAAPLIGLPSIVARWFKFDNPRDIAVDGTPVWHLDELDSQSGTGHPTIEFNLRQCFVPNPIKQKIRASPVHYAARSFDEMWRQQHWRPDSAPQSTSRRPGRLTREDIIIAFRRKALRCHPDQGGIARAIHRIEGGTRPAAHSARLQGGSTEDAVYRSEAGIRPEGGRLRYRVWRPGQRGTPRLRHTQSGECQGTPVVKRRWTLPIRFLFEPIESPRWWPIFGNGPFKDNHC